MGSCCEGVRVIVYGMCEGGVEGAGDREDGELVVFVVVAKAAGS